MAPHVQDVYALIGRQISLEEARAIWARLLEVRQTVRQRIEDARGYDDD